MKPVVAVLLRVVTAAALVTSCSLHGWHDGTELVVVAITFDAGLLREGASIELVNVVVR